MTVVVPKEKAQGHKGMEKKETDLSKAEIDQHTFSQVRVIQEITVEGVSQVVWQHGRS